MEGIVTNKTTTSSTWLQNRCRQLVFSILNKLDGGALRIIEGDTHVDFGKQNPHRYNEALEGVIEIHDPSAYPKFVRGGSIGAAEAFIAGLWSSPDLTKVIRIFARAQSQTDQLEKKMAWVSRIKNKLFHRRNRNSHQGSKQNILAHYDLGNELYSRFLDPSMMYSSAIFAHPEMDLAQAQQHKLKQICQRLELTAGEHLIEIGTGWGSLAVYAAQHYDVHVTTTTISEEQYRYAEQQIKSLGLEDKITLLKKDYRDLTGQYDKLVSIEMIEAVGYEYMDNFFSQCNQLLKPGGKMLIQAITIADQRFDYYLNNVDFIQRYIFPGGFLPSLELMSKKLKEKTDMVLHQLDDFGLDYAKTLRCWRMRFLASWQELLKFGYDERFKNLWLYYLCYCEGAFLERSTSTVHFVARKAR
ncbi:cyclopropane-fatty-acyl-phospholipid synthase family protein [Thalassotalea ponticola]|uniref:SAM-dependent methyltransferase n=1 Tax=Thalassotalea ponticola TaxID=1523392 RepID=UPI0025B53DFA|nr:cyclopropane-fatty-acyl-phospholipid synthase family protein [Thalassotalea ponticola]MDN3651925.1 cyclopropane-fatty-acyl-phospholipid synthase family protein [Thalassotalea ponticola]